MEYGRIIDANLNRAREGLRVVEEICRFHLNDVELFEQIKAQRHLLKEVEAQFSISPILFRAAASDVGRAPHPLELQRSNLKELLTANCKRVEESLRVLEEFSKAQGGGCELLKQARFRMYDLEQTILLQIHPPADYSIYLLTDDLYLVRPEFFSIVEACLEAGVTAVQYRAKSLTSREMYQQCRQLRTLTQRYQVPLLVNDRVDLALAVGANGVHLGQGDLPLAAAQQLIGERIIGISVSNYLQAVTAVAQGADYLGVGPIFPTPTKADAEPPCGVELITQLRKEFPTIPLVGIGGITLANAAQLLQAGVQGLAIISAILDNPAPASAVHGFASLIEANQKLHP